MLHFACCDEYTVQSTVAKLSAEKTLIQQELSEVRSSLWAVEKEKSTMHSDNMRLQSVVSGLQLEKQGLEGYRETLQWQIKNQEQKLQVCPQGTQLSSRMVHFRRT
jgi:hypothetical protein